MVRVGITTPVFAKGDAIGNDVVGMARVLAENDIPARIFSDVNHTREDIGKTEDIGSYLRDPSDVLIFHHSIGWSAGIEMLRSLNCRKIMKYHNITPPEHFGSFNTAVAEQCALGRAQVKVLIDHPVALYVSDSDYSTQELILAGADPDHCRTLYPFNQLDVLLATRSDPEVKRNFKDESLKILMVGRVSPNKGHPFLIDVFHRYHRHFNPNSKLILAGKSDANFSTYVDELIDKIKAYKLQHSVIFTGEINDSRLKSYYQCADLFMITSEHEGFCVPLIEAMSMRLPIIAYGTTAVPYTVGQAGIVWEEKDADLFAESIHYLVEHPDVRTGLAELGYQRYQRHFTNEAIGRAFLSLLRDFL
jgi:glycosyltransferase involved in cell wall biosynthesis